VQYRKFGSLDWKVSALGFGCMRLPTLGESSQIDEPEAIRMLRYAIDHGVNYLDTAYPYHGGNSERVVGKALQDGYREKVRLATKLPTWNVKTRDDVNRLLSEQLEKLQVDKIDFYLLHSLSGSRWREMVEIGVLEEMEKALADGRIRYLGFSFHDSVDAFKEIVDGYDGWTMCQIQYNYMNEDVQAGTEGLEYAASKGLAVVIMEPLLGGRLVRPPEPVQKIWDSSSVEWPPSEWALQWLWNKREVSTVLSGMSTMAQVQENLVSASSSGVGLLSEEQLTVVRSARDAHQSLCPIPCTNCKYCMPCPNGVNIPGIFAIYNEGIMYNEPERSRQRYDRMDEGARASACVQCRVCEEKCPQGIAISEWMPIAHKVLGEGAPFGCQMPQGNPARRTVL